MQTYTKKWLAGIVAVTLVLTSSMAHVALANSNGEAAGLKTEEREEKKPRSTKKPTVKPVSQPTLSPEDLEISYLGEMPSIMPFMHVEYLLQLSQGRECADLLKDPYIVYADGGYDDTYTHVKYSPSIFGEEKHKFGGNLFFYEENFIIDFAIDTQSGEQRFSWFPVKITENGGWQGTQGIQLLSPIEIFEIIYDYLKKHQKEPLMDHLVEAAEAYLKEATPADTSREALLAPENQKVREFDGMPCIIPFLDANSLDDYLKGTVPANLQADPFIQFPDRTYGNGIKVQCATDDYANIELEVFCNEDLEAISFIFKKLPLDTTIDRIHYLKDTEEFDGIVRKAGTVEYQLLNSEETKVMTTQEVFAFIYDYLKEYQRGPLRGYQIEAAEAYLLEHNMQP